VGRDVEDFSFPERECSFRTSGSGSNNRLRDIKRRTDTITLRYVDCTRHACNRALPRDRGVRPNRHVVLRLRRRAARKPHAPRHPQVREPSSKARPDPGLCRASQPRRHQDQRAAPGNATRDAAQNHLGFARSRDPDRAPQRTLSVGGAFAAIAVAASRNPVAELELACFGVRPPSGRSSAPV
jgi:hypothetical protein